uniref:Protein arginine methyltransferase NDUFAF7 n=1 Tax=Syphacia muris TaxID=451379 RepID=A0A0N5AFJ6_9BILA
MASTSSICTAHRILNSFGKMLLRRKGEITKNIFYRIRLSGPIPVAEYMRIAINSPTVGYYSKFSNKNYAIFGEKGDFITAPELCQLFGELIGVWCYYELANTGHRGQWQLVESGPGTGQLMNDIVRVMEKFEESDLSIHFIETSDALILKQEETLCSKKSEFIHGNRHIRYNVTRGGIPIYWYRSLSDIPEEFSVFIANEFLDALPVHQFLKDNKGCWHEVYVSLDSNDNLAFMLSKNENIFTLGLIPGAIRADAKRNCYEVCPDAGTYINQVAEHITTYGGFGLIVDYGHDGTKDNLTLRAYHKHKLVNPLESPGRFDLTADVNFAYLKSLVENRVLVFGPEEQREFLGQMGIRLRLTRLLEKCASMSDKENLIKAYNMLLSEDGMGTRFKALSVFPSTLRDIMAARGGAPAGFLTDVVSEGMNLRMQAAM